VRYRNASVTEETRVASVKLKDVNGKAVRGMFLRKLKAFGKLIINAMAIIYDLQMNREKM
jgi:hypothetical protein